ncbi:hypothetical protein DFQ28_005741 [Apophysomyces sp. BC1034]|nr:hypothetical protein DFQ28_005741 [Apophysomyces sp. BC1034]
MGEGLPCLETIKFPSREHELDGVLARFAADQPLRHLDLTGFLQVTDEGVRQIARMTSLRYLSLDGTKVCSTSKNSFLTGHLYRILDYPNLLVGLSKLNTLSLSCTQVGDAGLCLIGDSEQTKFTRNLRTLNLSQCRQVSDKGIRGLTGMLNLTNLNLDHTAVSKQCLRHLQDLEWLKPVRLLGVDREEEDQD